MLELSKSEEVYDKDESDRKPTVEEGMKSNLDNEDDPTFYCVTCKEFHCTCCQETHFFECNECGYATCYKGFKIKHRIKCSNCGSKNFFNIIRDGDITTLEGDERKTCNLLNQVMKLLMKKISLKRLKFAEECVTNQKIV